MSIAGKSFNEPREIELRFPKELDQPGLLLAWSLDFEEQPSPMGFSTGNPHFRPRTGWIDPILMMREGHVLTIAPTGAGKGRSCIIPALLRHPGPVIVIDPKGENVAVTARHRREMGQEVVVLDPMGITGEPKGAFNPLDLIDAESVEAVDLATGFATAMVEGREDVENAYWYQRAQFLLTSIMLHVACDRDPGQRSFARVREILSGLAAGRHGDEAPGLSGVALEIANSPHPEARRLRGLLQSGAREGFASILSMAQNGVDFLRGPLIEAATRQTDFPLDAVTRGDPLSIYIVLPPHMLESHGRLLRLWVMALLALITRRRGRPEQSTLFLLDEAAQLGALPQLRQAITLLRGYGVQTWSFWQDASQLRLLYPHDWQTMVNNCAAIQCFGALNQTAADSMAELTGFGNGRMVLDLNSYQMLLQMAGKPAIVARKPDYLNDAPFAGRFDPNPFHNRDQAVVPPPPPRIALLPQPVIVQPDHRGQSSLLDRRRAPWRDRQSHGGAEVDEDSDSTQTPADESSAGSAKHDEFVEHLFRQLDEFASSEGMNKRQRQLLLDRVMRRVNEAAPTVQDRWMGRIKAEAGFPWYWNWPQLNGLKLDLAPLDGEERSSIAGLFPELAPESVEVRCFPLSFYPDCSLVHGFDKEGGRDLFAIIGPEEQDGVLPALLDTTSPPIHKLNHAGRLKIEEIAAQLDYLRFFCMMVQGELGPFRIIEPGGKDVDWLKQLPDPDGKGKDWTSAGLANIPPLRVAKIGLDGRPQMRARVRYGPAFFNAVFAVDLSGMTEMLDDEQIGGGEDGASESEG